MARGLSISCTTERRLAQPDNVDVFVLTVPDEIQCKPASLIAARCLSCCLFVTYIVCVCVCVCVSVCVHVYLRWTGWVHVRARTLTSVFLSICACVHVCVRGCNLEHMSHVAL